LIELELSVFIGWIILLSRVAAAYTSPLPRSSPNTYISQSWRRIAPITRQTAESIRHRSENLPYERFSEKMKPATIIGILLILLGVIGFATGGFSFTHKHKDVDAGPIQISHDKKETVPISPILSTIALVAGVGLIAVGAKSK
jgi:hypothetical protein